jgi:hypothetical protein
MAILHSNHRWYVFRDDIPPPWGEVVHVRWLCSFGTEKDALTWLSSFRNSAFDTAAATSLFLTLHGQLPAPDVFMEVDRADFLAARRSSFTPRWVEWRPS